MTGRPDTFYVTSVTQQEGRDVLSTYKFSCLEPNRWLVALSIAGLEVYQFGPLATTMVDHIVATVQDEAEVTIIDGEVVASNRDTQKAHTHFSPLIE